MAAQARGAKELASWDWCDGMLVRGVCQVVLSSGFMPRRVQTSLVKWVAWSLVKAWVILLGFCELLGLECFGMEGYV